MFTSWCKRRENDCIIKSEITATAIAAFENSNVDYYDVEEIQLATLPPFQTPLVVCTCNSHIEHLHNLLTLVHSLID